MFTREFKRQFWISLFRLYFVPHILEKQSTLQFIWLYTLNVIQMAGAFSIFFCSYCMFLVEIKLLQRVISKKLLKKGRRHCEIFFALREKEKKNQMQPFLFVPMGVEWEQKSIWKEANCVCVSFFFNTERLLGGNIKAHVNITPRDTQYVVWWWKFVISWRCKKYIFSYVFLFCKKLG